MRDILNMPFARRKRTDEEYVEMIRRAIKLRRMVSILSLCMGLLLIIVGFSIPSIIIKMLGSESFPNISDPIMAGMVIGLMLGSLGGVLVCIGMFQMSFFSNMFFGARTEKMLIKYYDENMKHNSANHGLESTGAPPAAGTPETHP